MAHTKKGRKVALVAGLALVVLSVAMVWTYWNEIEYWYAFRRDFERNFETLGKNEQGRPEYRHRQTGIVFVALPGGTFEMGSPDTEQGREEDEGPVHKVTLSPFLIAKYEISQAEWKKVMGVKYSAFKGDTHPRGALAWVDCQEFCKKTGASLPTEAQWEYACRAGTSGPYAGTGELDEMGRYQTMGAESPFPIGQKLANQFGVYDMHGNEWEWCVDVYDNEFYSTSEATQKDPVCTSIPKFAAMPLVRRSSFYRVIRGGAWYSHDFECRSAYRQWSNRSDRRTLAGFRPAWSSP